MIVIGAISCLLALTGCAEAPVVSATPTIVKAEPTSEAKASIAAEKTNTPSSTPVPINSRTEVIWGDYDPGTQNEIDRMTTAGDCVGINSFFGMATATEDSVKARTGHGNEALVKYLNESLALAQCN